MIIIYFILLISLTADQNKLLFQEPEVCFRSTHDAGQKQATIPAHERAWRTHFDATGG
jgi:hypothetical protein